MAARFREMPAPSRAMIVVEGDELDRITNRVVALIREGKMEEALRDCEVLLSEYPEVIDGLDRSARVHEALGQHEKAAEFYRRCLEFIEVHPEGFEAASVEHYEEKLAKALMRLA